MQYMILIYSDESKMPEPPTDAEGMAAYMQPWIDYTEALKDAKVFVAGDALQSTSTATSVRMAAGKPEPVFTDGPFAETKEQLGGYYLIDVENLDQALAWGGKCPGVHFGTIEVRPVADFG